MILYGLKNCDTCRKAQQALATVTFVDVRADGVPPGVLERALMIFGDGLVNTRSTTWRGLSPDQRQRDPITLLRDHPSLMKRPLIVDGDRMWLGWGKDVQEDMTGRA